jgi:acyl phosphate:glycerol-3-phosphate acyltransferase
MWYQILIAIMAAALGYLLGAVPVGYLIGKAWGVDVRKFGSGRTGGTNVWRATKALWPPALTVLGDIAKGMVAVYLARYLFGSELAAALAGAAAVIGHIWPVFLAFRGGAGGVTAGATLVALSPITGGIVAIIAIAILIISRYASLATLTAAVGGLIVLALTAWLLPTGHPWTHVIYGAVASAAVVWALRPNLKRLIEGNERRITIW